MFYGQSNVVLTASFSTDCYKNAKGPLENLLILKQNVS